MATLFLHSWWLLLLAVVGVVALATVVITLFTALGDRPESARMVGDYSVDSADFLFGVAGTLNSPLQRGGTAQLLNGGNEFFPAMYRSLRGAEHTINFMVYIWEPGVVSDEVFAILTERAAAGVQVRVMVDGLGGRTVLKERITALEDAGGQWAWFHPPRFGMLTRIHKRNHRRAIVIDGRIGYTGGAAVMDKWLGDGRSIDSWRDSMVEVRGCLATNLQAAFTSLWTHVTGELLMGPYFYDTSPPDSGDPPLPGEPISMHVNVVSSPSSEAHPMRGLFWLSFRVARQHIYVTNPYFVPDEIMQKILEERARAGVDVRVLVPSEHTDVPLVRWASQSRYERMLEAGIRIFEYQPTMIHSKTAVVDGKWSLIGSANMDVRSKELNQENALGILDVGFARQVTDAFHGDLEYAREIDLETFRRRPLLHRVRERLASLFEEQF